mmetsp:Transcript_5873/g.9810  ORF Transcript_5873/g.9810 Transcript_5873/m.9810 type:complete len:87 (-) Transcript_5873:635-895(-)
MNAIQVSPTFQIGVVHCIGPFQIQIEKRSIGYGTQSSYHAKFGVVCFPTSVEDGSCNISHLLALMSLRCFKVISFHKAQLKDDINT